MKKLTFIALLLTIMFPSTIVAFPTISDDSWSTEEPTNSLGYSSQMTFVYDEDNEDLLVWNGHVSGGGYPQSEGVFRFNLDNYSGGSWGAAWSYDRPSNESPFKV